MSWTIFDKDYHRTPIGFNYETGTESGSCIECGSYQSMEEMEEIPDGYVCTDCYYKWIVKQEEQEVENE